MPALALEYPPNLTWGQPLSCPRQGHTGRLHAVQSKLLPDGTREWWCQIERDDGLRVFVPYALCERPRDLSPFWARAYGGRRMHWWQPKAGEAGAVARCGRQSTDDVDQVRELYAQDARERCPNCERLKRGDRKRGAR